MNEERRKKAEQIALRFVKQDPAVGSHWWETERKIQTVKPMNYKRMIIALIVILAILLAADFAIVKYGLAGAFLMTVRDEQDEPKMHSDDKPGSILWVMGGWAVFVCLAVAYFIFKYCGVL